MTYLGALSGVLFQQVHHHIEPPQPRHLVLGIVVAVHELVRIQEGDRRQPGPLERLNHAPRRRLWGGGGGHIKKGEGPRGEGRGGREGQGRAGQGKRKMR